MNLQIGKTYDVRHLRSGRYTLKVTEVNEPWVTGVITTGRASALQPYNQREVGDEVTIRKDFATFTEVEA